MPVAGMTVYDRRSLRQIHASLTAAGFHGVVAMRSTPTQSGRKEMPPVLPCWKVLVSVGDRWGDFKRWIKTNGLLALENRDVVVDGVSVWTYTALAPR